MSIVESIEAILAEGPNFNVNDGAENILIVEGKDDIEVIEKYYFYKNRTNMPFRVCIGEDFGEDVSGKVSAILSFERFKDLYSNIMCLLDRDLDFQLGLNKEDARILYYDYFELENYLFDDSVLKVFISRFYEFRDDEIYQQILAGLCEISRFYIPISKLILAREICNKGSLLDDRDKFHKIAELSKQDIGKLYANKSPEYDNLSFIDKINLYIKNQLAQAELDVSFIDDLCSNNEAAATLIDIENTDLNIFKYALGTKYVIKSLQMLMQKFIECQYNKEGGQVSLERSLKREWIPSQSEKFSNLMSEIENKF